MTQPAPGGTLYDLAAAVLAVVEAGYAADNRDLPTRRYISPGVEPVHDCPQVTVNVVAVRRGIPGEEENRPISGCPVIRYATLRIEIIRSTPTQTGRAAPTTAVLDTSAREVLYDLDLLDRTLGGERDRIAGYGDPAAGRGIPVFVGAVRPLGVDAGLAGSQVDLDVPLRG